VVTATPADRVAAERMLAGHLVEAYGAPGLDASMPAALDEVAFVESLCRDASLGAVFAVRRTWNCEGCIREEFQAIRPASQTEPHARIWTVVDDES
jgi:hypothetical protein